MKPLFPAAIDSTLRASFVSCPRKFELQYLHHWKSPRESVHLIAGMAFAEGLEVTRRAYWDENLDPLDALAKGTIALIRSYGDFEPEPQYETKSLPNLIFALSEYFTHYGFSTDHITPYRLGDKHAIEFTFALPISPDLLHPETGDPILYTGRFDMLGEYQDQVWPVDEKTTSYLGKTWHNNWNLRSQFTGYVWACQEFGIPAQGAIVRGIALKKTGIDFGESIQHRPRHTIEQWHTQLIRDVRRMISLWKEGYFDLNLDHACTEYGGCIFQEICTSAHPERWLSTNFVQRVWDPLTRTETTPAQPATETPLTSEAKSA